MHFALLAGLVGLASAATSVDTFANVTIFDPDPNNRVTYVRTESIPDGSLFATWSNNATENGTIPIYRSTDNGFSWYTAATVTSDETNRRLVQPHLLYINETFGSYTDGVLLLAVNAIDNTSTNIQIYASADSGDTWSLATTVATGGKANTTNGATPVWEPFLMYKYVIEVSVCYCCDGKHGLPYSIVELH